MIDECIVQRATTNTLRRAEKVMIYTNKTIRYVQLIMYVHNMMLFTISLF